MRRIILLVVLAAAALGLWSLTHRQRVASPAGHAAPEVPIQDRKTIDFSSGKPVVKDTTAEQAVIDRAAKAMDAAAAGVTFAPVPAGNSTSPK